MFKSELELVGSFIEFQCKKKNRKIITELTTNYGRPDIVEIVYSDQILKLRNNTNQVKLERIDSYLLTYLYGKRWVRVDTIQANFSLSNSTMNKSLLRICDRGLITYSDGKVKLLNKQKILAIKQLKVYEAKLYNWKYVIEQAERHLWFSNNSNVILPNLSDRILERCLESCQKRSIGLVVSDGENVNSRLENKNNKLINTPLLWELNEKLIDGSL